VDEPVFNYLRDGAEEERVGRAGRRRVEDGEREVLLDDADVEVDDAGGRDVDLDVVDGEPHEEVLRGDARDGGDLAGADDPGHGGVVAEADLEARGAGSLQLGLEPPRGRVVTERRDPRRQQAPRQLVRAEHLVRRLRRRRRRHAPLRRKRYRRRQSHQRPQRGRHSRRPPMRGDGRRGGGGEGMGGNN